MAGEVIGTATISERPRTRPSSASSDTADDIEGPGLEGSATTYRGARTRSDGHHGAELGMFRSDPVAKEFVVGSTPAWPAAATCAQSGERKLVITRKAIRN